MKQYLGDGVYVDLEGGMLKLMTDDGRGRQKGNERVVQVGGEMLRVEVMHHDALGDENWIAALPDTAGDAIAKALLSRLTTRWSDG